MKKSFLASDRPILTTMINNAPTPEAALKVIARARALGTDAFGLQIEQLLPVYRTRTVFSELFDAMGDCPAYITNYRRCSVCPELSDEALTEQMLLAIECGAVLFDMRGDLFAPSEHEITYDTAAIAKQKEVADTVHRLGGEVLISSHVLEYLPADKVLELSLAHSERGADISKIVTDAADELQLAEAFRAELLLNAEVPIKTLFLVNGAKSRLHRVMGPALGSCMYLNVIDYENYSGSQVSLKDAKAFLELCRL